MPSEDGGAWKEKTDCFTPARSPGYVQGCRALMITAILLGFLGLFLGMVGLRCTNVGNIDLSRKAKILAIAGALHILAGNGGEGEKGDAWVGEALTTAPAFSVLISCSQGLPHLPLGLAPALSHSSLPSPHPVCTLQISRPQPSVQE